MDKFLLSLKTQVIVPVVVVAGMIVWLLLCNTHYQSYWNGTINRVQTTDFNILHHTLPCTLSQLVIAGRDDLVQEVLDSNYGIFGLVVTDPSGESVLYKTSKIYHKPSWQTHATPEDLALAAKKEPYDLLTDPPPLESVYEHRSPRAEKASRSGSVSNANQRVIGHLYYLRPDPPSFFEDLAGFFTTGIFELSGAKRGYLFITLTVLGFSLVVLLLIWLRQRIIAMQQSELQHIERELAIRQKALEHLSSELTAQKSRKTWLEKEADESYKRALGLKQALERLKNSMTLVSDVGDSESPASEAAGVQPIKIRPAVHPPSALLEEIENLIPVLTDNAGALRSQASLLHDYCHILEERQSEMKKIVEKAYIRAQQLPVGILDMSPH